MRRAFGQVGFGKLYGGLAASMLGDSMMLLVLSIWVKTLTGSNALAGLTFLFMVVPSLFAPLLGVLIDRVRRRPMLVWVTWPPPWSCCRSCWSTTPPTSGSSGWWRSATA